MPPVRQGTLRCGDVVVVDGPGTHHPSPILCVIERQHADPPRVTLAALGVQEGMDRVRLTVPRDAVAAFDPKHPPRGNHNGLPPEQVVEALRIRRLVDTGDYDRHWGLCFRCGDDGKLLMCDSCMNTAHAKCAGLRSIPKGDWHCEECSADKCYPSTVPPAPSDATAHIAARAFLSDVIGLVKRIASLDVAMYFADVPTVSHNLPDYADVVPNPMDLATVASKARRSFYTSLAMVRSDVEVIASNCISYNVGDEEFPAYARRFLESALAEIATTEADMRSRGVPSSVPHAAVLAALGGPMRCAKPLVSPGPRVVIVSGALRVAIHTFPSGDTHGEVRYTTDDAVAPYTADVYKGPFIIRGKPGETVRVRAVNQYGGMDCSIVSVGTIIFAGGSKAVAPPDKTKRSSPPPTPVVSVAVAPPAPVAVMTTGLPPLLGMYVQGSCPSPVTPHAAVTTFLRMAVAPAERPRYDAVLRSVVPKTPRGGAGAPRGALCDYLAAVAQRMSSAPDADTVTVLTDLATFLEINHAALFANTS